MYLNIRVRWVREMFPTLTREDRTQNICVGPFNNGKELARFSQIFQGQVLDPKKGESRYDEIRFALKPVKNPRSGAIILKPTDVLTLDYWLVRPKARIELVEMESEPATA